jgi:phospholipid transport system substrate-binding protein
MWIRGFILTITATLLLGHGMPAAAVAVSPTETMRESIDRIVTILNDPAYKEPDRKATQRQKIWEVARPMFDFEEISRRTVGAEWQRFTPQERERFGDVFARFLGNTYIDRLQSEYQNDQIIFSSELVRDTQALVRTQLVRQGVQIPIDYRMKFDNGEWKIYDILVEGGVSLVKNYRVQFQSALQKETPAQLIDRLEKRSDEPGASDIID